MSSVFQIQLQQFLDHPEKLKNHPEQREELLERIRVLVSGEEPTVKDIQRIASASGLDFKSLMWIYLYPQNTFISDKVLQEYADREDIETLLVIASEKIFKADSKFYLVNRNFLNRKREIDLSVIEQIRNLFLKNGYPGMAAKLTSPLSFYHPESLDEMICTDEDFAVYLLGSGGWKMPAFTGLSEAIFNGLSRKDQETVLTKLIGSYKELEVESAYTNEYMIVRSEESSIPFLIGWFDFNRLQTESPLLKELISAQEDAFRAGR